MYAVLGLAHEIFLNISTEFWPLIDVKISIFINNEWVDLIKSGTYIDIFYGKTCATTKISTVVVYHVVLATLLFIII